MNDYNLKMQAAGQCVSSGMDATRKSPTLLENIDYRIASLKDQVERLERVKELLGAPAGLLNVPIDDLRFAMNY